MTSVGRSYSVMFAVTVDSPLHFRVLHDGEKNDRTGGDADRRHCKSGAIHDVRCRLRLPVPQEALRACNSAGLTPFVNHFK